MTKPNETVIRETLYIAAFVIFMSVLMQAVFLIIGKWDYTVILGNLFGAAIAVLNFLLMGLTIQKAVLKEQKSASLMMRVSQAIRLLVIVAAVILGAVLKCFNLWAMIIPLLFPRVAVQFRPLFNKYLPDSNKENQ